MFCDDALLLARPFVAVVLVKFVQLPPLPFSTRAHGTVPDGTLEASLTVLIAFIEISTSVLLRTENAEVPAKKFLSDT